MIKTIAKRHFTNFFDSEETQISFEILLRDLRKFASQLIAGKLCFSYGSRIVRAEPIDTVRSWSEWRVSNGSTQVAKNIILSALASSEAKCSGSAALLLLLLAKRGNYDKLPRKRCRPTTTDIITMLCNFAHSGLSSGIAEEALKVGAVFTRIEFTRTDGYNSVEPVLGRSVDMIIDELFINTTQKFNFTAVASKVIYYEGIIESIGEIHHLLDYSNSHDYPVYIIAHGWFPDVSNTLAQNWLLGKLRVVPCKITEDIGEVCNELDVPIYSIEMSGSSIDLVKLIDESKQRLIGVHGDKITISSEENTGVVDLVTIQTSNLLDVVDGLVEDRVRILISTARAIARHGFVTLDEVDKETHEAIKSFCVHTNKIPRAALQVALEAYESTMYILQNSGPCITSAEEDIAYEFRSQSL